MNETKGFVTCVIAFIFIILLLTSLHEIQYRQVKKYYPNLSKGEYFFHKRNIPIQPDGR